MNAERSTPDDPRVEKLYFRARALLDGGDVSGAIATYQEALILAPDLASLHAALGAVLDGVGDLTGALNSYTRAQRLHPRNPRFARATASLHARIGSGRTRPLAGAMTVPLDGKMPEAPDPVPAALVGVARAVRSSEVSPADRGWVIAALRVALRGEPENERLHVKLSNLLQAEGDRAGAATHMREANRLSRTRMSRQA